MSVENNIAVAPLSFVTSITVQKADLESLVSSIFHPLFLDKGRNKEVAVEAFRTRDLSELNEHKHQLTELFKVCKKLNAKDIDLILDSITEVEQVKRWPLVEVVTKLMATTAQSGIQVEKAFCLLKNHSVQKSQEIIDAAFPILEKLRLPVWRVKMVNLLAEVPLDKIDAIVELTSPYIFEGKDGQSTFKEVRQLKALSIECIKSCSEPLNLLSSRSGGSPLNFLKLIIRILDERKEQVFFIATPFLRNCATREGRRKVFETLGSLSTQDIENVSALLPICKGVSCGFVKSLIIQIGIRFSVEEVETARKFIYTFHKKKTSLEKNQINYLVIQALKEGKDVEDVFQNVLKLYSSVGKESFSNDNIRVIAAMRRESVSPTLRILEKLRAGKRQDHVVINQCLSHLSNLSKNGRLQEVEKNLSLLNSWGDLKEINTLLSLYIEQNEITFKDLCTRLEPVAQWIFMLERFGYKEKTDLLDWVDHVKKVGLSYDFLSMRGLFILPPNLRPSFVERVSQDRRDFFRYGDVLKYLADVFTETRPTWREELRSYFADRLSRAETNPNALQEICQEIDDSWNVLELFELHPLVQKMIDCRERVVKIADAANPYRVHQFHHNESGKEVEVQKVYTFKRKELQLNPELMKGRVVPVVRKEMLPQGVDYQTFKNQLDKTENAVPPHIMSFLQDNWFEFIMTDIGQEEDVRPVSYQFIAIVHYLSTLDDETLKDKIHMYGSLLSWCEAGKEESITKIYNDFIPKEFRLNEERAQNQVENRAQKKVEEIIAKAHHKLVSNFNSFTFYLGGSNETEENNQVAHTAKYVRNLIGDYLGIQKMGHVNFDINTTVLHPALLVLSKKELLDLFYEHCTPAYYIKILQNEIDKDLKDKEQKTLLCDLNNLITNFGAQTVTNSWRMDKDGNTRLTDHGALDILIRSGLYKEIKDAAGDSYQPPVTRSRSNNQGSGN